MKNIFDIFTKTAFALTLAVSVIKGCGDVNRNLSDYAVNHRPETSNQLIPR